MKVLIVPTWYFPEGTQEIAGRMFHHLAHGLREKGVDAAIFYPAYSAKGPLFKKKSFKEELGVPTCRVTQWFPPKGNAFLFRQWIRKGARDLLGYIKKYGKPDLLHAQSYHAATICAAVHQQTGIPFVYSERLSSFLTRQIPPFHLDFFKPVFEQAAAITCVSPGLMDMLQPHAVQSVKVIPNFYDQSIFYPDLQVKKNNSFTFVSVGEPAQTKGLDILLQSFAGLKQKLPGVELQLTLTDRIPEEEELKKMAQSLGIESQLTWTGLLSQEEMADIFRRCHALVSASRVETFGKAMVEAQACGLPVVATKTDGAKFILTSPAQGELVEIENIEALQRGMGKLYTGYANYSAEGIVSAVEKRFSQTLVISEWIKLYQSIVA